MSRLSYLIIGSATIIAAALVFILDRWPVLLLSQPAATSLPSGLPSPGNLGGGPAAPSGSTPAASVDTDSDGLSDVDEGRIYFTDPAVADTDLDTLTDGLEVLTRHTDPLNPDTDRDSRDDGSELRANLNPLVADGWQFNFTNRKGSSTRTPRGLRVVDSSLGTLPVIPWIELTNPNYTYPGRDRNLLEVTKRGIVSWSKAGATKVGVMGVAGWMGDDNSAPGYQNKIIADLTELAKDNGMEIIFGVKWISYVTDWQKFFTPVADPNNNFKKMADLMTNVLNYSKTNQWIVEGETALQWLRDAYVQGQTDLTASELAALKANTDLLAAIPALSRIYFAAPNYVANNNGLPHDQTTPRTDPNVIWYVHNKVFETLFASLGNKFISVNTDANYGWLNGVKLAPFTPAALANFKITQNLGVRHMAESVFMYQPFRHEAKGRVSYVEIERGVAELVADLPYLFGYGLNNQQFFDLNFETVMIYPGAANFDLVGQAMADYLDHGLHLSVRPGNSVKEGDPISMVFKSAANPTGTSFSLSYYDDCEPRTAGCVARDVATLGVNLSGENNNVSATSNHLALVWRVADIVDAPNSNQNFWFEANLNRPGSSALSYPVRLEVNNINNSIPIDLPAVGVGPITPVGPVDGSQPGPLDPFPVGGNPPGPGGIGQQPNITDPNPVCSEDWRCGAWGACVNGRETRSCVDVNSCSTLANRPASTRTCVVIPGPGGGTDDDDTTIIDDRGSGGGGNQPTRPPVQPAPVPQPGGLCSVTTPRRFSLIEGPFGVGMKNDGVRLLQEMLLADSRVTPRPQLTSTYDNQTTEAVRSFQRLEGIVSQGTIDTTGYGLAGPRTRARLNEIYGPKTTTTSCLGGATTPPPPSTLPQTSEAQLQLLRENLLRLREIVFRWLLQMLGLLAK